MTYQNCRVADDTVVMVHELLKTEADMDGIVIVSFVYVGEKLGIHKDTVGRAVERLISQGLVERLGHHTIHQLNTLLLTDF